METISTMKTVNYSGPQLLRSQVYEFLRNELKEENLKPGMFISINQLIEQLGISRTPVREAIHKLEREDLLRQDPKGGFFVVGLTREDIEETFGIRSVLESYAAKLAAIRHLEGELRPLEEKLRVYQESLDRGDLNVLPNINTEFHDLLYGLSRSPKLIKMINDLRDHIYRFRLVILKIKSTAELSNNDHRLMLKAMSHRDTDGVERLVKEHILRGQEIVLRQFDTEKSLGIEELKN